MKIPRKVKVGAMTYTVVFDPQMYERESRYGRVTYADQRIRLAGDVSKQRQFNAFVHELTHAITFEAGNWESTDDEEFTRKFSNMLTQVAVDNGWRLLG